MTKLSIEERLTLLTEAENFFADLSSAWKENEKLWLRKAAALWTVNECLEIFRNKILNWKDWTEETLEEWLATVIGEDYIDRMIEINWMSDEEADFYRWGFWLAIWIIKWEKGVISWLKELEKQYDYIARTRTSNKTIADLLK